jgi:hypothetical protein
MFALNFTAPQDNLIGTEARQRVNHWDSVIASVTRQSIWATGSPSGMDRRVAALLAMTVLICFLAAAELPC